MTKYLFLFLLLIAVGIGILDFYLYINYDKPIQPRHSYIKKIGIAATGTTTKIYHFTIAATDYFSYRFAFLLPSIDFIPEKNFNLKYMGEFDNKDDVKNIIKGNKFFVYKKDGKYEVFLEKPGLKSIYIVQVFAGKTETCRRAIIRLRGKEVPVIGIKRGDISMVSIGLYLTEDDARKAISEVEKYRRFLEPIAGSAFDNRYIRELTVK
jgi:hypothetical protein